MNSTFVGVPVVEAADFDDDSDSDSLLANAHTPDPREYRDHADDLDVAFAQPQGRRLLVMLATDKGALFRDAWTLPLDAAVKRKDLAHKARATLRTSTPRRSR